MNCTTSGELKRSQQCAKQRTNVTKKSWNDAYPPALDRPRPEDWPAWCHIPPSDMRDFFRLCSFPSGGVRILEVGAGDGRRVMCALNGDARLNQKSTHVVCIDHSPRAIAWGIDLWSRLRIAESVPLVSEFLDQSKPMNWSMCFREENALLLPDDFFDNKFDILIDWMFLHGLNEQETYQYREVVHKLSPKMIILKCFSKECSSLQSLPRAVNDVEKRQWSETEVMDLWGDTYRPAFPAVQCPEDRRPLHPDGPIAAKREYCFIRTA